MTDQRSPPAIVSREEESPATNRATDIEGLIQAALDRSGFPVQKVFCRCDGETVILSGQVMCYFHVQVALAAALRFAGHRLIINRIEVIPPEGIGEPVSP
jgi:hypothetical protein